jgi:hypothetical protein
VRGSFGALAATSKMPRQAPLRTIKRWQRYQPRDNWSLVPRNTRGLYVLYRKRKVDRYEVCYIGVAGLGVTGGGGIRSRLKSHKAKKPDWTHYSLFEVHDNVTRDEIRELEALLLGIFRHDMRIELSNKFKGSLKLRELRRAIHWKTPEHD